jgi:hypothetical protein
MASRIEAKGIWDLALLLGSACQRRQDREDIPRLERGLKLAQEAHVFVVEVNVDEAVDLAVYHYHVLNSRVLALKVVDDLANRGAFALDDALATYHFLEGGGYFHFYWHVILS